MTERRQAIPVINGWSWEAYPSQLWQDLPQMLAAARPGYVFVDHVAMKLIPEMSPQTDSFIDSDYVLVLEFEKGRLYARRSPPPDTSPISAGIQGCDGREKVQAAQRGRRRQPKVGMAKPSAPLPSLVRGQRAVTVFGRV